MFYDIFNIKPVNCTLKMPGIYAVFELFLHFVCTHSVVWRCHLLNVVYFLDIFLIAELDGRPLYDVHMVTSHLVCLVKANFQKRRLWSIFTILHKKVSLPTNTQLRCRVIYDIIESGARQNV